jgi:hypothetical protein
MNKYSVMAEAVNSVLIREGDELNGSFDIVARKKADNS